MSLAFEITLEDVHTVIEDIEQAMTPFNEDAEVFALGVLDKLDMDSVEKSALYGDDIDEQTSYALAEIKRQIVENDLLK